MILRSKAQLPVLLRSMILNAAISNIYFRYVFEGELMFSALFLLLNYLYSLTMLEVIGKELSV